MDPLHFLVIALALPAALLGACRRRSGAWLAALLWVVVAVYKN
jgi:hypothetical protein